MTINHSSRWNPKTKKVWLYLAAGIVWSGVGMMLAVYAAAWLGPVGAVTGLFLVLAGLILAGGVYLLGFSRLAKNDIQRISSFPKERICLFAFQKWTSYPLVLVMVGMGIYLRLYSPIPKPALAILYLGIGVSLFASSLHYFSRMIRVLKT